MLVTCIFFFSHNSFYLIQNNFFPIWITFDLSSADALNLDWFEILSFGKDLKVAFFDGNCFRIERKCYVTLDDFATTTRIFIWFLDLILYFYAPTSKDRGILFYRCPPVRPSVCLSART